MKMKIYRDGLEEIIDSKIRVSHTRAGHTIEKYSVDGHTRYFVTLYGTHYCAHGSSVAEAITDALWKDPSKRPSLQALVQEIQATGRRRKISLAEFQLLTGACAEGCRVAIQRAKVSGAPMTATDIRDKVNYDWGTKLLQILGWKEGDTHEE